MPYICLAKDLPDATIFVDDLEPNESQRNTTTTAYGQTRYVNRVQDEPVFLSLVTGKVEIESAGLRSYLADRVVPGGLVAPTGSITAAGTLAGDTVTIAGVVFTATAAAGVAANQEFDIGTDDQIATNLAATINDPASQALITAALGGSRTIAALAALAVCGLTAGGNDVEYRTLGTLTTSNVVRLVRSARRLEIPGSGAWTGADLATASAAIIARVDAGQALAAANINTALSAVVASTSLTAGGSNGTVADVLSILAGRGYVLEVGAQVFQDAYLPHTIKSSTAQGAFTRAVTQNGALWVDGEIRPLNEGGDTVRVEIKPIRSTVDSASLQLSIAGGALAALAGQMSLFPDSDDLPFYATPWQPSQAVSTNLTSQRVVTVYDDDGSVLA